MPRTRWEGVNSFNPIKKVSKSRPFPLRFKKAYCHVNKVKGCGLFCESENLTTFLEMAVGEGVGTQNLNYIPLSSGTSLNRLRIVEMRALLPAAHQPTHKINQLTRV